MKTPVEAGTLHLRLGGPPESALVVFAFELEAFDQHQDWFVEFTPKPDDNLASP
jgi:hypothetical protein